MNYWLAVETYLYRFLAPNILASAASAAAQAPTTRCMLMLNMVTPEELYDDQEYQEILEDINEECSKYGEVEGVRVPRPVKRETKWAPGETAAQSKQAAAQADEEAGVGKVFVLFKDLDGVSRALQNIAGRSFGGRTILCANVSEVCVIQSFAIHVGTDIDQIGFCRTNSWVQPHHHLPLRSLRTMQLQSLRISADKSDSIRTSGAKFLVA